jgi:hypothetical protein
MYMPTPPHNFIWHSQMEAEKEKWEMDEETQRKSRQRMHEKDNSPCNNQLKRSKKNGRQKEGKLQPRKLSSKKCLKRSGSNIIPR